MAIRLDHVIVPPHDRVAGARALAELQNVPWEASRDDFSPVYVADTFTLDFASREEFEPSGG